MCGKRGHCGGQSVCWISSVWFLLFLPIRPYCFGTSIRETTCPILRTAFRTDFPQQSVCFLCPCTFSSWQKTVPISRCPASQTFPESAFCKSHNNPDSFLLQKLFEEFKTRARFVRDSLQARNVPSANKVTPQLSQLLDGLCFKVIFAEIGETVALEEVNEVITVYHTYKQTDINHTHLLIGVKG